MGEGGHALFTAQIASGQLFAGIFQRLQKLLFLRLRQVRVGRNCLFQLLNGLDLGGNFGLDGALAEQNIGLGVGQNDGRDQQSHRQ